MKYYKITLMAALLSVIGCSKSANRSNDKVVILETDGISVDGQFVTEDVWRKLLNEWKIDKSGKLNHSPIKVDATVKSAELSRFFAKLGEYGISECQISLKESTDSITFATVDSGNFPELSSLDNATLGRIYRESTAFLILDKINVAIIKLAKNMSPLPIEQLINTNQNRNPKLMPLIILGDDISADVVISNSFKIQSLSDRPVLFVPETN